MSMRFGEQIIAEYAIEDTEIQQGEVEIHIAPPFDAGHLIHFVRQLEKHGYKIRESSGSFRHGCLITISMATPTDVLKIVANVPGIRDVRINDDLDEMSEGINHRLSNHSPADRLGVSRITVTTEPTKAEIDVRLRSLEETGVQDQGHEATTGLERPAEAQPSDETSKPKVPVGAGSGDEWTRRMAFDIRHRVFKR